MAGVFVLLESDDAADDGAPSERPSASPGRWLRENLFSSVFNSALTVVFAILALWAMRGLLNFVFSEERSWDAVRVNLRLLLTQAYPEQQYVRIWVSLGVVMALLGLSLGLSANFAAIPLSRICSWLMTAGALIAVGTVLREPSVLTDAAGTPLRDAGEELIRQSFTEAMADRISLWAAAALLGGTGLALWYALGDRCRRRLKVAAVPLALALLGLLVASLWVYPWGHYGFADGTYIFEPDSTVAMTTKAPWTVMWLLLVAAWVIGGALRLATAAAHIRTVVNITWLLVPFILYWVILRDPRLDWSRVWAVDVPMALAFAAAGGAVLWFMTRPGAGELDRIIAVLLLAVAAFHWVAAFFGWYPMLQKARLSFLLLAFAALLAPNFIGVTAQRLRLVAGWVGVMAVFHYMATIINTPSTVETPTETFLGGFSVTLLVAVFTLLFSFPLGVLLALARTSRMPIFRVLATSYIEAVRGIPLITILFFFSVMVPLFLPEGMSLGEISAIVIGFTLFSAAYLAENIRGGLQSVRHGQFEASDAVGLTAAQRTAFIVLPQALRVSIPPLVGQVIAVFKETSLVAIVGIFDFLRIADAVISNQSEFLGVKREGLLFASAVYWLFAFAMSKYSQRLERRVGLGER